MQEKIRNFSIIAHIDHGKSTLADRMLQITNTVGARDMRSQYLDKIDIERERGITIKLQPARMEHQGYILNLIDTPGHIDFSYEVSRALAACEGAILLVDASQGIEAQTLSNIIKAQQAKLKIIPVVNKIDLSTAHPEEVALDLAESFGFQHEDIIFTSGKSGEGIGQLLQAIIDQVPAPAGNPGVPPRALIFDSYYDQHQGVIAYVRVVDGTITPVNLYLINSKTPFEPIDLGYIGADQYSSKRILTGEVGYLATGLKDINRVRVGDTITIAGTKDISPLGDYQEPQPMVYTNIFPEDAAQAKELRKAVEQYNLMDAAFTFEPIKSQILGAGFRCGFLGLLHVDIVQERLDREFNVPIQITTPNVQYYVTLKNGDKITVQSPAELPEPNQIREITEPWCEVRLFTQQTYVGSLLKVSESHRGKFVNIEYLGRKDHDSSFTSRVKITYQMPLSEVISNFFDEIKSVSSGYASLDYEITDYRPVNLIKMEILLNKEPHPALARLVIEEMAPELGKKIVNRLREVLPRQQFKVPIQAAIGGSVVARADVPAVRKDVTEKLYGGDRTRKDKLLKKQVNGKKRMQEQGRVSIPSSLYQKIISI